MPLPLLPDSQRSQHLRLHQFVHVAAQRCVCRQQQRSPVLQSCLAGSSSTAALLWVLQPACCPWQHLSQHLQTKCCQLTGRRCVRSICSQSVGSCGCSSDTDHEARCSDTDHEARCILGSPRAAKKDKCDTSVNSGVHNMHAWQWSVAPSAH